MADGEGEHRRRRQEETVPYEAVRASLLALGPPSDGFHWRSVRPNSSALASCTPASGPQPRLLGEAGRHGLGFGAPQQSLGHACRLKALHHVDGGLALDEFGLPPDGPDLRGTEQGGRG